MEAKCSLCEEKEFDYILFKEQGTDIYHYHNYWQFEIVNKYCYKKILDKIGMI